VADGNVYGTQGLIWAVQQANTNGTSNDIICLAPNGTYNLNTVVESNSGLPIVTTPITIWGYNATISRTVGSPTFRIWNVSTSGDLTIENLMISGGSSDSGGAIFSTGKITLTNVTLSNNTASVSGGAIYNRGAASITNALIDNNTSASGGGVYNIGTLSTLTITGSTISNNTASNLGGGIGNSEATIQISQSIIRKNSAKEGGGLHNGLNASQTTITDTYIYENTATERGGGLSTDNAKLTANNSCLVGNNGPNGSAVNNDNLTTSINVTNNWWGRSSGPIVVTELRGLIVYSPYLTSPASICAGEAPGSGQNFDKPASTNKKQKK
jgi:predicted outer membrane repeat protein